MKHKSLCYHTARSSAKLWTCLRGSEDVQPHSGGSTRVRQPDCFDWTTRYNSSIRWTDFQLDLTLWLPGFSMILLFFFLCSCVGDGYRFSSHLKPLETIGLWVMRSKKTHSGGFQGKNSFISPSFLMRFLLLMWQAWRVWRWATMINASVSKATWILDVQSARVTVEGVFQKHCSLLETCEGSTWKSRIPLMRSRCLFEWTATVTHFDCIAVWYSQTFSVWRCSLSWWYAGNPTYSTLCDFHALHPVLDMARLNL